MTPRRTLIVLAHPLPTSYCAALARAVEETLAARGCEVDVIDLYADGFDPRLSAAERAAYFQANYDTAAVEDYVQRLRAASGLVFVFPQWWGNCPAILKGYLDRVFVPGVAYDPGRRPGTFVPRLRNIGKLWVVTTAGAPWWVSELYLGNPVRRQMKRAVGAFCVPSLSFRMMTLHGMDSATKEKRHAFLERVRRAFESY